MTALVRTTGRVARAAPGAATTPPPRRGGEAGPSPTGRQADPLHLQRQGAAMPMPRVIGGLDGQTVARH